MPEFEVRIIEQHPPLQDSGLDEQDQRVREAVIHCEAPDADAAIDRCQAAFRETYGSDPASPFKTTVSRLTENEFGDRYFDDHEFVSLPITKRQADWTLEGWFMWLDGDGPLVNASDGTWGWLYARDRCAYRIGSVERATELFVAPLRGRWIYVAVAKAAEVATLWLNDGVIDTWESAPAGATLSDAVAMKHAVGLATDIAYYDRRIPDASLKAHWHAGRHRV